MSGVKIDNVNILHLCVNNIKVRMNNMAMVRKCDVVSVECNNTEFVQFSEVKRQY
jgi:hypothetical protein